MLEKNKMNKTALKLADNLFLYRLDESLMWLFNIDTGEYWNLNKTSCFVLSQFDGRKTLSEIGQLYVEKYLESGVGKRELLEDFKKLINQFISNNVLSFKANQEVRLKDEQ